MGEENKPTTPPPSAPPPSAPTTPPPDDTAMRNSFQKMMREFLASDEGKSLRTPSAPKTDDSDMESRFDAWAKKREAAAKSDGEMNTLRQTVETLKTQVADLQKRGKSVFSIFSGL